MYYSLALLLLSWVMLSLAFASTQEVFETPAISLDLSSTSFQDFTRLSHPSFPKHSARIKQSKFCDGSVRAYTGYIDVGARHLFFYFFESRNDPDKDDVMLWTNGGPGGSSAMGLFMELGPCNIISPNETEVNPYSWNSNANIFFIDQPSGVGLSYADFGESITSTEDAAKDIAAFMAIFFETFTKFKGRAFHLSGESYAGRYLPVYASEIYDQNIYLIEAGLTPVNLKSVMIGNGATDFFQLLPSYYDVQCTNASVEPIQPISVCVRMKQALPRCKKWTQVACIDHFDIMDCGAAFNFCAEKLMIPYIDMGYNQYDMKMKCDTTSDCYLEELWFEDYLNNPQTRELLGIDPSFGNYSRMSFSVNAAFWSIGDALHQNQFYVTELLERGVKVLIYVGTHDFVCNWVGNERWTLNMKWSGQEEFTRQPLREWLVDGETAGKTRSFGNFTFATINGAGHLAPHDKPVESLEMVKRWLADDAL